MELSLVGGTSARTRRSLKLGGRLKAIRLLRDCTLEEAIWGVENNSTRYLAYGGREGWYVTTRGTFLLAQSRVVCFSESTDSLGIDLTFLMAWWTARELWPLDTSKVLVEYLWMTQKVRVIWGSGYSYRLCWSCSAGVDNWSSEDIDAYLWVWQIDQ